MQIVKFSVQNYRSITETHVLELGAWTVLVGPNNEGKSNLVRALVTALEYARSFRAGLVRPRAIWSARYLEGRRPYVWADDYPLSLQESDELGESVFRLWFRLSPTEKTQFKKRVGTRLASDLPVEIRLGPTATPKFAVRMRGRGARGLNDNAEAIARFVGERLDIEYIPAVRTAESARKIVARVVDEQLMALERDAPYRNALAKIAELQRPILEAAGHTIQETLSEFLPDVASVSVRDRPEERLGALRRSYELVVDDGTATPLSFKGDGVQSIAALSLMRARSAQRAAGRDVILAVEEPEAHLHPAAIHRLRSVLQDISTTTQVVMTTHHPAFVDRVVPGNNVIVQSGHARCAKTIEEVRVSLGVLASDNLRNAELVLFVEGETDRVALSALLAAHSIVVSSALASGRLRFEVLGGADKLPYFASLVRNALASAHAFLDFDQSGRQGAGATQRAGSLLPPEVTYASARGNGEAEIEDMYCVEIYAQRVRDDYGVQLPSEAYRRSRMKWSGRMGVAFADQGQDWDACSSAVKQAVAESVAARPADALHPAMRGPFDALVTSLEKRLSGAARA